MDNLLSTISSSMQKVSQLLNQDLGTVRTGRATPSLVDQIEVTVYSGTTRMKVLELATIAVSDPQTLVITPFDPSILGELQKGIQEANIGYNPANDGKILRINIPPLSEERRKDLIHVMRQKLENGKIMIRQARQDGLHAIKKIEDISEDGIKKLEKEIQNLTDEYMKKIDSMGESKEKELLQM